MPHYFWEDRNWPNYRWNSEALLQRLAILRKRQGRFLRAMEDLGLEDGLRAQALATEEEAIQTAAIEGENLDREKVRSSIATRLGLSTVGLRPADRTADGLVEVLLDAMRHHAAPLTKARLGNWHTALFPSGRSGFQPIVVGAWCKLFPGLTEK
jgi:Fic family protein